MSFARADGAPPRIEQLEPRGGKSRRNALGINENRQPGRSEKLHARQLEGWVWETRVLKRCGVWEPPSPETS